MLPIAAARASAVPVWLHKKRVGSTSSRIVGQPPSTRVGRLGVTGQDRVVEAQGVRIEWEVVPDSVQSVVAAQLGAPVVTAVNEPGGFSPGVAARCQLADGRRCFIKAVSTAQNPDSPGMHRREAAVAGQLPADLPAPRLLATVDDGDWVVLAFEEVEGCPPRLPWQRDELNATFDFLAALASLASPCPLPELDTFAARHRDSFFNFRRLADGDTLVDQVDPWTSRHLDHLADLEAEWESAADGDALLHSDIRADNLLVRPDGSMVLVDWPHACVGASWVDLVCFLPSIAVDGGPTPSQLEEQHDLFGSVDPDRINRVLVGVTGLFTVHGLRPDPPGLPTVRAFQRAQAAISRAWLAGRLRRQ